MRHPPDMISDDDRRDVRELMDQAVEMFTTEIVDLQGRSAPQPYFHLRCPPDVHAVFPLGPGADLLPAYLTCLPILLEHVGASHYALVMHIGAGGQPMLPGVHVSGGMVGWHAVRGFRYRLKHGRLEVVDSKELTSDKPSDDPLHVLPNLAKPVDLTQFDQPAMATINKLIDPWVKQLRDQAG